MKILKILVFKNSIINSLKYTCIFLISNLTIAQSSYLNLDVENDLYFLTDEYYSSGIFIETGKVVKKDSIKKFKIWELGQEIYTPSDTDSKDFEKIEFWWIFWAINFFPVPVSPVIKTLELDCPILLIFLFKWLIKFDFPIKGFEKLTIDFSWYVKN